MNNNYRVIFIYYLFLLHLLCIIGGLTEVEIFVHLWIFITNHLRLRGRGVEFWGFGISGCGREFEGWGSGRDGRFEFFLCFLGGLIGLRGSCLMLDYRCFANYSEYKSANSNIPTSTSTNETSKPTPPQAQPHTNVPPYLSQHPYQSPHQVQKQSPPAYVYP